jgi:hypothetical protein
MDFPISGLWASENAERRKMHGLTKGAAGPRRENPPHGFNSMPPARSSSLENQRAGMRILHSFAARLRYPDLVRGYVQSCQTPDGGFGRASGAIPQLAETRLALQVLLMLAPA